MGKPLILKKESIIITCGYCKFFSRPHSCKLDNQKYIEVSTECCSEFVADHNMYCMTHNHMIDLIVCENRYEKGYSGCLKKCQQYKVIRKILANGT